MKKLEYPKNQRLRGVRVNQVWLKEDLLQTNSTNRVHPGLWNIFNNENKSLDPETRLYINDLKGFILSAKDLFIIFFDTETKTDGGNRIGGQAFLTDRKNIMEITPVMVITNLAGCRCKVINPPFEDFINEFIVQEYF